MKHYTIALEGDLCECLLHGRTKIVIKAAEIRVAAVGDKTVCGCSIVEGSTQVIFDNRGVAYQGAKLSNGGSIIGASSPHLLAL